MIRSLTKIGIDALLKQGPPKSRKEISDGQTPGLRLIIQPSGAMSWAYRYLAADSKFRKMTLGPYSGNKDAGLTIAEARQKAQEAHRKRIDGIDPASEQKEQKRLLAEEIAKIELNDKDKFQSRFNEYMRRDAAQLRSSETIRSVIERRFFPKLKDLRVTEVKRKNIQSIIDDIMDANEPSGAIQAFAFVRRFSNWLVERGVIEVSFCNGMKPPAKPQSCERYLSADEIRWFWKATGELGYPGGTWARLLVLTGARRTEASHMTLAELDFGKAEWKLPAERSKNKTSTVIPLSPLALEELQAIPLLGNPPSFMFSTGTGRDGKIGPIGGYSKIKTSLDAAMLKAAQKEAIERGEKPESLVIPNWTYHDLRRTCASFLGELGIAPHVVEAALNHKTGQIQGLAKIYNRYDYFAERRQALEALATRIKQIVSGKEEPSNVVRMRG